MMNLTINVSEELYRRAAEVAAEEKVSIEELFAAAFEQRVLEFERLKDRAEKGSYDKFRQVTSKVASAEAAEYDRLWRLALRVCEHASSPCLNRPF